MAKVTITIEDSDNGSVRAVSDPSFETMMHKLTQSFNPGDGLSAAEGYAVSALNHIRKVSRDQEQKSNHIILPRIKS